MFLIARTMKRNGASGPRRGAVRMAKILALAAAVLAAPAILPAPKSMAGDLGDADVQRDGGRFVRIGLNKSVVIRLPGEARDVIVGNPDIVDAVVRTRNTAYLFARSVGQTNIFFFDANGQQILALDLEVAQDMAALQKLIRRTLPGTRITVDTIGENIVLGGIASTPAEAKTAMDLAIRYAGDEKKVLTTISVTGKEQVMLRVRIAEVQRSVLKQFGIDAQGLFSIGKFGFNLASINPFSSTLISPNGGYGASYNGGCGASPSNNSACGIITAMERDGLLRTLAEPTLTAISGESAKFLAGGEFPIPVNGDNNEVTIEFKPFGVGLGLTPVVLSEGRISLKISTEVSEISTENAVTINNTFAVPSLNVRRAETTVELPSGGSMALAGLIKDNVRADLTGTPGLRNLPVLGALFRSRDFQSNQSELVVIVTPYVVDPVHEKELATPLDGLNIATDRQAILFGRLNKVYGVSGQKVDGTYHGNVGYIVE